MDGIAQARDFLLGRTNETGYSRGFTAFATVYLDDVPEPFCETLPFGRSRIAPWMPTRISGRSGMGSGRRWRNLRNRRSRPSLDRTNDWPQEPLNRAKRHLPINFPIRNSERHSSTALVLAGSSTV